MGRLQFPSGHQQFREIGVVVEGAAASWQFLAAASRNRLASRQSHHVHGSLEPQPYRRPSGTSVVCSRHRMNVMAQTERERERDTHTHTHTRETDIIPVKKF